MRRLLCLWFLLLPGLPAAALPCSLDRQKSRQELLDEYGRRYKAVDQNDPAQLAALATWCAENDLRTYANLLFRRVLKLDPDHAAANRALGNEEVEGKWYPAKEAAELRAKLAAAKGGGEASPPAAPTDPLLPPDETTSRATVASEIAAGAPDAGKLVEAFAKAIVGIPAQYAGGSARHVSLVAKNTAPEAERMVQIAEYVYRRMNWITWQKIEADTFASAGGRVAFYLTGQPHLESTMEFLKKQHPTVNSWNDLAEEVAFIRKYQLEFTTFHTPPIHVHLNTNNQASAVANVMGRMWLQYNAQPWYAEPDIASGRPKDYSSMVWMLEGLGIWASLDAVGTNRIFRIQEPKYANETFWAKGVELNYPGIAYEAVTKGESEGCKIRTIYQLSRARLNLWNIVDLAMSFALVDYLIRERLDDWRQLVRDLKGARSFRAAFVERFGTPEEVAKAREILGRTHQEPQLEELWREVADRFEKGWRDWVTRSYQKLRDDPNKYLRDAAFPPKKAKKGG